MKILKISFLITICFLCSCGSNPKGSVIITPKFVAIKSDSTDAHLVETEEVTSEIFPDFMNATTNQKTKILQHLEHTGFHVYNDLKFPSDTVGVLVGGTGLVVRITKNAGKSWKQFRFSEFGDSFYSVDYAGDSFFVVGSDEHIYKTSDLGENWSVYNLNDVFATEMFGTTQLYKIQFFKDKIGFIVGGEREGLPTILKTTNGGDDWCYLDTRALKVANKYDRSNHVLDLKILSEKEIMVVTWSGECYKSIDQGENWNLVYQNQEKIIYAIDFKDATTGFIGESERVLFTNDGAKTWTSIDLPKEVRGGNITDILYTNERTLISTTSSYGEREAFVYAIGEGDTIARPFLTKKDNVDVYFEGESQGITVFKDSVFILDRNNLYKTSLIHKN